MSAAVIAFPERNKGRKRRCGSMDAAGLLSLCVLDREGEAIPPNVQRMDEPDGAQLPSKSAELLFATLIWSVLTADQQERMRSTLRVMAYGKTDDPCALQLHNLLNGRR